MAKEETRGRKNNQKMKPYLVYQYLLHNADANHPKRVLEIVAYLQAMGIDAERKSVCRDIDAINRAIYLLEHPDRETMDDVEADIEDARFNDEKTIVYDEHKKGYYVRHLNYDESDIRLIAECVYSSKYISQSEAERLVEIVKGFVSDEQVENIRTDALVLNRNQTLNTDSLKNVAIINTAMAKTKEHSPEQISFDYLEYDMNHLDKLAEGQIEAMYVVSPYKLIINDGNYYLLAFDHNANDMRTYRVDRMKSISLMNESREGEEAFAEIDLLSYMRRTFGMFNGGTKKVRIIFRNSLLDTVIETFGTDNATYLKTDDHHFTVSTDVEITEQFFGWICGFGEKAVIEGPDSVKLRFIDYINRITSIYW